MPKYNDTAYRVAAIKRWEDATELIEIDRCTAIGATEALVIDDENNLSGAWVKAWIWVSNEDAAKEEMSDEADPKKFYKWTVELEVNATWVADGFDLTDERARRMVMRELPHALGSEIEARVIRAPIADEVAREMGYKSANDRRKKSVNR